jgi:flagellar hook-associated protein 2
MTTSVTESITKTLGSGSGVDLKALVANLVTAQYATKTGQLTTKADTLTAQISGVAKLKSAVTGFDAALKSLVTGGTLQTQPTSSNASVLTAALQTGGKAPAAATTLTVRQIAAAQAATSATIGTTDTFKGGTLAITIGSASKVTTNVTVAKGASLADVAAAIKSATGLATSIVADGDGSRLTIKGATGESQAFSIAATDTAATDADPNPGTGLAALATGTGGGMTIGTTAQDAKVVIDGASYTRSSNSINNLIDGVKLTLVSASDTPVTIGATPPTSAISQAVSDFVETFNQMRATLTEQTNATSGVLKSDSAATAIGRALQQLTTTKLATSTTGGPQTLADIGVATNRDGTLTVDTARLTKTLASDPSGVEALFANGTGASGGGLSAAFSAIATRLTDKTYGLDAATTRYTKAQTDVTDAKAKLTTDSDATSTRLTQQFAAMDAKVAAYKSTQTFLTNQIAAWNKSDS